MFDRICRMLRIPAAVEIVLMVAVALAAFAALVEFVRWMGSL